MGDETKGPVTDEQNLDAIESAIEEANKELGDDGGGLPDDDSDDVISEHAAQQDKSEPQGGDAESDDDDDGKPNDDVNSDKDDKSVDEPKEGEDGEKPDDKSGDDKGDDDDNSDDEDDEKKEDHTDEDHEKFAEKIDRKETKERFETVLKESKERAIKVNELEGQLETMNTRFTGLQQGLFGGGLNIDEVGQGLGIFESYKNMDAQGLADQHDDILQFVKVYETLTGKTLVSGEAYHEFDDLKQKVDDIELEPDVANELARSRKKQALMDQKTKANEDAKKAAQPSAEEDQSRLNAKNAVEAKIANYAKSDIDWKNKEKKITDEFVKQSQEGISSGAFTWVYLPQLFDVIVGQVTSEQRKEAGKTPNAHTNSLRPGNKNLKNEKKEIDIDSDDWITSMADGAK